MDIFERLATRIDLLPVGPSKTGLSAVKLHIGTAIKHLLRGESENDETAFTDAILRCNHAFEGSVKEAYRVLANKDPSKQTPASIENFLKDGEVLRKKVLDQFENYRKEWRNPSTHNYLLDFDANEALLAIVSVTVFAVVLCDQIQGRIAFLTAISQEEHKPAVVRENTPWIEQVKEAVRRFAVQVQTGLITNVPFDGGPALDEALAGFLIKEWADREEVIIKHQEAIVVSDDAMALVDILALKNGEGVAIETRSRFNLLIKERLNNISYFAEELLKSDELDGVVLFFADKDFDYEDAAQSFPDLSENIRIIG